TPRSYDNKYEPPSTLYPGTQELTISALENVEEVNSNIQNIIAEREQLKSEIQQLPFVEAIYHSDANFLLVKMQETLTRYKILINKGIVVRDRSKVVLCEGCLRITVGTPEENSD